MSKRAVFLWIAALVVVALAVYVKVKVLPALTVELPEYQAPGKIVELDQHWSAAQRTQFHHTAQGTRLIPYAWFVALEQPCLSLFPCEKFTDPKYLERFGFLSSPVDPALNPDGLPVGFARQMDFHDPVGPNSVPTVGLTCAACHTGELRYGGYSVQIEGAPAMIEVTRFQQALGLALLFAAKEPFRNARFVTKVLGPNATDEQKTKLKADVEAFLKPSLAEKDVTDKKKIYANEAGFIRTDALTRIGNQVFAVDMNNDDNFAVANAPVRFPQIWDASWFDWVQYNSSIADPMVRNIGEALGVRAPAKLYGPNALDFDNSVDVKGAWNLELLLSGNEPYGGLRSPKWPAVFPAIDARKRDRGAELYKTHCQGCHLPPVEDLLAELQTPKPAHWWKNGVGRQLLVLKNIPVEEIGTDGHEALDFIARTAETGDLKQGRVSAAVGLQFVTSAMANKYYDKMGFTPEQRIEWNGYRDPKDPLVRAEKFYKARPLNGIWAVAPYLHNGSVPNLYALLSPVSERPATFWTGTKAFQVDKVGYDPAKIPGGYLFDVTQPGNSNTGHEFKDGPRGHGVIGPGLAVEDRWALIEYLKSL